MLTKQIQKTNVSEFSRCEGRTPTSDYRKTLSPTQKSDALLKEIIYESLWQDEVIRAVEYSEIDVYVFKGVVHLDGHISSTNSRSRVENSIRGISGILKICDHLILDDRLSLEVATSLSKLERTFDCKFFTGASHGVVSLNGEVNHLKVKLLAEKFAANHPNVRGVINNIKVFGVKPELQPEPFLQPMIGESIYFLDWASGIVKQVIINPNNRRVIAMVVQGKFNDYQTINSQVDPNVEQIVTVPMNTVRYMNKVSGFLDIHSNEKSRYADFDFAHFIAPNKDWLPPYPYCSADVLIPITHQNSDIQISLETRRFPFGTIFEDVAIEEEYLSNDSLGG